MNRKTNVAKELTLIKRQLEQMSSTSKVQGTVLKREKDTAVQTGSNLFTLLKYMVDENRKTTMLLKSIASGLERLEYEMNAPVEEEAYQAQARQLPQRREVLLSGIDAKIVQCIQRSPDSMACADEIKARMQYKGRNAASARLNKLYRMGVLERYQLGKTVYYKYDAGKATSILIVSPPQ